MISTAVKIFSTYLPCFMVWYLLFVFISINVYGWFALEYVVYCIMTTPFFVAFYEIHKKMFKRRYVMDFTSQGLRGKEVFLEMRRASIQSISILWPYVIMLVLSCAALLLLLRQRIEYLIELPLLSRY